MTPAGGVILCLAYILGLLSTAIPWQLFGLQAGGLAVLALGTAAAFSLPRFWRTGPKFWLWLAAGTVGFLATLYFQARTPQPAASDVSRFAPPADGMAQEQKVVVWGVAGSMPRLTRSQKAQFWLEATNLKQIVSEEAAPAFYQNPSAGETEKVTGRLYVTVPLLQATGLNPGQLVAVTGKLYQPKPPANPGGFDFKAYLATEGCFAGLAGRQVSVPDTETKPRWGWWAVRQRIVRSQVRWLGVPEGPLVSVMALGKLAADLPHDIQDRFRLVGLAHALAASGAQVSMILGVMLALTGRFSARTQFIAGTSALVIFTGLAGLEASVCRAALMGFGALVALVMERKVKPLGSLLVAATLLLIFNPLWIWDLGFELSFLATLGLVVTVPGITARLDWMPVAIASAVAVPLAASVWTLPLQLYCFGLVSPYSIFVNIITTPLIALISLGGFASALAGLIWPLAGSGLAWLLLVPAKVLLGIAGFFSQLPGNTVATGTISALQLLALYGIIVWVWLGKWWHKGQRWGLALLFAASLVLVPVWHAQATLFRVTVLATTGEPVLAIQDKGRVTLVNSGDDRAVQFTVLPFLQQQGVNHIEWAIATGSQLGTRSGWNQLLNRLTVKTFYGIESLSGLSAVAEKSYQALPVGQPVPVGSTEVQLLSASPPVLQLRIGGETWLLLGNLKPAEQQDLLAKVRLTPVGVLWWAGGKLNPGLLEALKPAVAIASSRSVDPDTAARLNQGKTLLYWTERDGAVGWTPDGGFETMVEGAENKAALL
jgi:competence protein ComEC